MFRRDTKKDSSPDEVDEVIETQRGELEIPILIGGRPPSKVQEQKAEQRIQQAVKNSSATVKTQKEKSQDTQRSQRMLKMLPDAFIFTYGERQGDRVQLKFRPNPQFHAHSHEEEVFHAMEGSFWVDAKENRLAELSGRLDHGVKFWGGILGYLDKGGTFDVKQEPISPGYWELTVLNVQMRGKALFFRTISVQQQFSREDFKRVPDNLSLAQAHEMLKKEIASQEARKGAAGSEASSQPHH